MQDYEGFYKTAFKLFDGRVYKDYLRRFCYGVEASCYSYIPKLVLMLKSEKEIIRSFFTLCYGNMTNSERLNFWQNVVDELEMC